jgi:hypothetical protein
MVRSRSLRIGSDRPSLRRAKPLARGVVEKRSTTLIVIELTRDAVARVGDEVFRFERNVSPVSQPNVAAIADEAGDGELQRIDIDHRSRARQAVDPLATFMSK